MTCEAIRDQLELYALNALEGDERVQVERHLVACAACEQRYQELQATVALLPEAAHALDPVRAPASLKRAVLESIQPPASRLRWRDFWRTGWGPALALANVCLLLALGWLWVDRGARLDVVERQVSRYEAGVEALLTNDAQVRLLGPTADAPDGSWGRFYAHPTREVAVVLVADTPPAPAGSDYHFWFKRGESFTHAGAVHIDPAQDDRGWLITRLPDDFDAVLVTLESQAPEASPQGPTLLAANY